MNDRLKMTVLYSLFWLSLWLFGIGILLNYAMRWWPGDNVRSVRIINYTMPWLLVILVPGVVFAWIAHHRWLSATLLAPILIIFFTYLPLFLNCSQISAVYGPSLKVMSYNVWGHNRNLAASAHLVKTEQPDILLLQELNPDHLPVFIDHLDGLYPDKPMQFDYVSEMNQGIISRFPIAPLSADEEKGRAQKVHLITPFGPITVINVHIHNFPWRRRQQELINILNEDIATVDDPIIFGGDFNTNDQSQAYQMVQRHLKNAHWESGCGFGFTFPSPAKRKNRFFLWPAFIRIDHIFYSNHFHSYNARTLIDSGGSDHYPVTAEIFPNQRLFPE